MLIRSALFILVISQGFVAQARVFNMSKESFSAYLRGTMSPKFTNTLASSSSGSTVTLDANHTSNRSVEFGFIYSSLAVNLRFGLEVLNPEDIKERSATNTGGTSLYKLNSEFSVTTPKMNVEINIYRGATSRVMLIVGVGYANLVARNAYTMTTTGTTALGVTDFSEDLRGTTVSSEGGLGYEFLMTDTTTLLLEAGYRSMNFTTIKHNKDVTGFQGSVVKGDQATNLDGTNRTLNLSNYYGGLTFRIWID